MLSFTCVFQEVLNFHMVMSNWESAIDKLVYTNQADKDVEDIKYGTQMVFDLNRANRMPGNLVGRRRSRVTSTAHKGMPGEVDVVPAVVSTRRAIKVRTHKAALEDGVLDVEVYETKSLGRRRLMCRTKLPLAGVVTNAFLRGELGYEYKYQRPTPTGRMEWKVDVKRAGDVKGQVRD